MNPDGGFEDDDLLRICGFAKAYFSIKNVYQNLSRPFTTSFGKIVTQEEIHRTASNRSRSRLDQHGWWYIDRVC